MAYLPGQTFNLLAHFTDHDSRVDVDPLAVRFVLRPKGTALGAGSTSTYGGAVVAPVVALTRTAVGFYRARVTLPTSGIQGGRWYFRWEADGAFADVSVGESFVDIDVSQVLAAP